MYYIHRCCLREASEDNVKVAGQERHQCEVSPAKARQALKCKPMSQSEIEKGSELYK
jgi:hypothetical protein